LYAVCHEVLVQSVLGGVRVLEEESNTCLAEEERIVDGDEWVSRMLLLSLLRAC
jgi:hypothetical protein